jgi:cytochrome c oxidase subunit 4
MSDLSEVDDKTDADEDIVEEALGLAPGESLGDLVPADPAHLTPHEEHAHPGPRQYVMIGLVLVILTAIEVAISYIETEHSNLIILSLAVLASAKFFLVCAWYMHMKQDAPFFRRLFIVGIVGASIVYGIVMFMFSSTVLLS